MTLLNPFSVELQKPNYTTSINSNPVYQNGDYFIYKYVDKHFFHTYKNIIIAERCGVNMDLIDEMAHNSDSNDFDINRAKEFKSKGIEAAKKLNFEVI